MTKFSILNSQFSIKYLKLLIPVFIFTLGAFVFVTKTEAIGWIYQDYPAGQTASPCTSSQTRVKVETYQKTADTLVNASNIIVSVAAGTSNVTNTSSTGDVCWNPYAEPVSITINGGAYQDVGLSWGVSDPAAVVNRYLILHAHLIPDGDTVYPGTLVAPADNAWINNDPTFQVTPNYGVHGATAVTGMSSSQTSASGSWNFGTTANIGPQAGLAEGLHNWNFLLFDNLGGQSVSEAEPNSKVFGIDRSPPTNVTSLIENSTPPANYTFWIRGYANDTYSGLDFVQILVDNVVSHTCDYNGELSTPGGCEYLVSFPSPALHSYQIKACDRATSCTSSTIKNFTVQGSTPPADPGGLSVDSTCLPDGTPEVTFGWWDGATTDDSYELTLTTNPATFSSTPSRTVSGNEATTGPMNTVWSYTSQFATGATVPIALSIGSGTYYWRVRAVDAESGLSSNWTYYGNTTTSPGNSYQISGCRPDLIVQSIVTKDAAGNPKSVFLPSEQVRADVTVKNQGPGVVPLFTFYTGLSTNGLSGYNSSFGSNCTVGLYNIGSQQTGTSPTGSPGPFYNGQTVTYIFNFGPIATTGSYTLRSATDDACQIEEVSGTGPEANNWSDVTYVISNTVSIPSNLTATPGCVSFGVPNVNFGWTDASGETGYTLQVKTSAWTGSETPAQYGEKTSIAANAVSFVWSSSNPTTGAYTFPAENQTYYWRVRAEVGGAWGSWKYPPDTLTLPGASFTTLTCQPNLQIVNLCQDIPSNPKCYGPLGQSFVVPITVYNNSPVATGTNFDIEVSVNVHDPPFAWPGTDCNSPKDGFIDIADIAPFEYRNILITVSGGRATPPGSHSIRAMVDSRSVGGACGDIIESNEADNAVSDNYNSDGFDLTIKFVPPVPSAPFPKQVFKVGETVDFNHLKIEVQNTPGANKPAPATRFGIWPKGGTLPDCANNSPQAPPVPVPPQVQSNSYEIGQTGTDAQPSQPQQINVSFNVGSEVGFFVAKAYVIWDCGLNPPDYNWPNNASDYVTNASFSYEVRQDSFFEVVGGDTCSQTGNVNVSVNSAGIVEPNTARYQTNYLLARNGTGPLAQSASNWELNNYSAKCVTLDTYSYFADRFRVKATGGEVCNIPAGLPGGFHQCTVNATFHAGNGPNGNNVFFIDGNLTIDDDLTLAANDASIFIVKGNITVNTRKQSNPSQYLTRIDGIYVAGGEFRTTTSNTERLGDQLVINGAVYAKTVNFNRFLGDLSPMNCIYLPNSTCNDQTDPAEVVIWDPKYMVLLQDSNLLGYPSVAWTEVAP